MSVPGVSVVVPTRGRPASVEALLASLEEARRAWPGPVQVLLADASTGGDGARVRAAAAAHDAVVVPAVPGVTRQRRVGVAAARHPVVWFVDSDCTVAPGSLAAVAAALAGGDGAAGGGGHAPAADAVAGPVRFAGPRTPVLDAACATGVVAAFDGFGAAEGDALPWAVTANLALRRSALDAVGGIDASFPAAEDVDLGLRLAAAGTPVRWAPAVVVHHDTATWAGLSDAARRFLGYGRADAHLLRRHPALAGPPEPCVVLALPLALAAALALTGRARRVGAAAEVAAGVAAWAVLSLALAAAPDLRRGPAAALRALLAGLLVECLQAGRVAEAVRLRAWRAVAAGVVLDPGQRARERGRRRRTAAALVVAGVALRGRRA